MPDAPATPSNHPSGLPYRAGVGVMLLNDRDEVFVGQRLDSTLEAWQMPQGGIDDGEDPLEAAFRELEEETGVRRHLAEIIAASRDWLCYDLPDDLIGKIWNGQYCGQRQMWYAIRFLGRDTDVNLHTAHPEFRAWMWAPARDHPNLIVPFKRDLYTTVLAEFADLVAR